MQKNGSAHFYFLKTVWRKKWRARPSVSVCCKLPESYFSTVLYFVFIFQILYDRKSSGKSGERDPQCQCVGNYPKVIFPFFHFSTVLYLVFIFQILYCGKSDGKSGEHNPQCVVNYPKVIFPFFHFSTVFGFYYQNTVWRKKWRARPSVCCKLP